MGRGVLSEDILGREDGPTEPDLWVTGEGCDLCITGVRVSGDDLCPECITSLDIG